MMIGLHIREPWSEQHDHTLRHWWQSDYSEDVMNIINAIRILLRVTGPISRAEDRADSVPNTPLFPDI